MCTNCGCSVMDRSVQSRSAAAAAACRSRRSSSLLSVCLWLTVVSVYRSVCKFPSSSLRIDLTASVALSTTSKRLYTHIRPGRDNAVRPAEQLLIKRHRVAMAGRKEAATRRSSVFTTKGVASTRPNSAFDYSLTVFLRLSERTIV